MRVARKTVDILFIYDLAKVKKRRKSKQIFETKFDRNVVYCDSTIRRFAGTKTNIWILEI